MEYGCWVHDFVPIPMATISSQFNLTWKFHHWIFSWCLCFLFLSLSSISPTDIHPWLIFAQHYLWHMHFLLRNIQWIPLHSASKVGLEVFTIVLFPQYQLSSPAPHSGSLQAGLPADTHVGQLFSTLPKCGFFFTDSFLRNPSEITFYCPALPVHTRLHFYCFLLS